MQPTKLLMYFANPPDLSPLLTLEEEGFGVGVGVFFLAVAEGAFVEVSELNTYQPLSDFNQPLEVFATTFIAVPALMVVTFE